MLWRVHPLPSLCMEVGGNNGKYLCHIKYTTLCDAIQIGVILLTSHVIAHVMTVSIDPGDDHVRNKSDEATDYYCEICQVNV